MKYRIMCTDKNQKLYVNATISGLDCLGYCWDEPVAQKLLDGLKTRRPSKRTWLSETQFASLTLQPAPYDDVSRRKVNEGFQKEALKAGHHVEAKTLPEYKPGESSNVMQQITNCTTLLSHLPEYRQAALAEVERQDRITLDLLHALEFDIRMSASEGYEYAKRLQECRRIRRQAKDDVEIIDAIVEDLKRSGFEKTQQKLAELKMRKYVPRESPELFKKPALAQRCMSGTDDTDA